MLTCSCAKTEPVSKTVIVKTVAILGHIVVSLIMANSQLVSWNAGNEAFSPNFGRLTSAIQQECNEYANWLTFRSAQADRDF